MEQKVERFISEDFAEYLYIRTQLGEGFMDGTQVPDAKASYGDPVMNNLLIALKPKVEQLYGKRLHETYSFYRVYTEGKELPPHTDRPACEVSVSICLGYSAEYIWPLFVDGKPFSMTPGEGVIYKGCDQLHWREPFRRIANPDYTPIHSQVFLHYIEAGGQFDPEHKYDGRTFEEMVGGGPK